MNSRFKAKSGYYLIECAICGAHRFNNEIILGRLTHLPQCNTHGIENDIDEVYYMKKETRPLDTQHVSTDTFYEFDLPFTPGSDLP